MYAVVLPIAVFLVVYYRRRDVYDLHHAILGDEIYGSIEICKYLTQVDRESIIEQQIDNFEFLSMQVSYFLF